MTPITVVFFGSTDDSVLVLDAIHNVKMSQHEIQIVCVVTQPPRPFGRKGIVTPTPVQLWAQTHTVPFLSFPSNTEKSWEYENEQTVISSIEPFQADLILSASYGQKIPSKTISDARLGGLNIHPSILPRWRGADPVPWAMIAGDHQTGVTIVTLSDEFDQGALIAQKKIPITNDDLADPLRSKLFVLGAHMLKMAVNELKGDTFDESLKNQEQPSYARKFKKQDGYVPWELLQMAMNTELGIMNKESWNQVFEEHKSVKLLMEYASLQTESDVHIHLGVILERFFRALAPWPGLWTEIELKSGKKRLKICSCHVSSQSTLTIDTVQIEGKNQTSFSQFSDAYLTRTT